VWELYGKLVSVTDNMQVACNKTRTDIPEGMCYKIKRKEKDQ